MFLNKNFRSAILLCTYCLISLNVDSQIRDISALELTKDMLTGWNLGNSFDVRDKDKTAWGNPLPTKAMIDQIKDKGFKTVRIPITWNYDMSQIPDYEVETAYLDRIEDVVDYVLENDMYAIINTHHDDWIIPQYSDEEEVGDRLEKLWLQIANRFVDYSDYLLFETMNEPRLMGSNIEWTGDAETRDVINNFNKICVDAIRSTGGNNAERFLMIPTYAANTLNESMDQLVIPNNDEKIIVSMHTYFPFNFTLNQDNGSSNWGSFSEIEALKAELQKVHDKFIANGQAIILGEWGAINRENTTERIFYYGQYAREAAERNIPVIVWDDGGMFQLFSRQNLTWTSSGDQIANAIIRNVYDSYGIEQPASIPLSVDEGMNSDLYWFKSNKVSDDITIKINLREPSDFSLNIYDLNGKLIKNFIYNQSNEGIYTIEWNTKNNDGTSVPYGIYQLVLETSNNRLSTKLIKQ